MQWYVPRCLFYGPPMLRVTAQVIGRGDPERFCAIALYQGVPRISSQARARALMAPVDRHACARVKVAGKSRAQDEALYAGAGSGALLSADATLFAASFKKNRVYCLSRRSPAEAGGDAGAC